MNANTRAALGHTTLAHLRAFCVVVERGGISAAAEVLDSSQPAVSLHVRALEQHFGVALLERLPRGVRPTTAGQVVYQRAAEMLQALDALEAEVAALHGLRGGRLALGASTTVANYVLPPLLGRFKDRYPAVRVSLEVENTALIAAQVASRRYTLGFLEGPVPAAHVAALQIAPFREDVLVLVVAGDGPLAGRPSVTLAELATLPFLMREPGSGTRQVLEAALHAAGATVQVHLELGHTEAIKTAVALGLGVSVLSRGAVARECQVGKLWALEVEGLQLGRTYTAIVPRGARPAPAEQAFLALAGVGETWMPAGVGHPPV